MDSIRTLFVWFFSLVVGWQLFYGLHVLGFILMVSGMMIYNEILIEPLAVSLYNRFSGKSEPKTTSIF